MDINAYKNGQLGGYNCFSFGNDLNEALVYGNIRLKKIDNNKFVIRNDIYDFDTHWDKIISFRNFATIGASIIHGYGTPYQIKLNGYWMKK